MAWQGELTRPATKPSRTFVPANRFDGYCGFGIPQQLRGTLALDWTQGRRGGVRIALPYKAIWAQRF